MAICSGAGRTAMRCLCNLVLRALATKNIFASSTCSLMKMLLHELVRPSPIAGSELPWLPPDILMDIFAHLEIPDLVRAGSVCASWRAACTSLCATEHRCKLQQTPCLLYTSESLGDRAMGLYSLAEKKAYTLALPDPPIRSREIIGSSYGWIITADERSELQLVNPITGDQIALPSVTTIEQVQPVFDDEGTLCNYEYSWHTADAWVSVSDKASILDLSKLRDVLFYKASLSSDPSTGDYFVVLIHNPESQLSFARAGDEEWTWLPPHTFYEDCQFQGGLLYATTADGEIHAFDLGAPALVAKIILNRVRSSVSDRIYTVQAPCGELLQIRRFATGSQLPLKTSTIQVHKVDLTSEKLLVLVNTLGENVLFIGRNQTLCLCAKEYPQLKPNHAYFTEDDYLNVTSFKNLSRDIGQFDLENNRNMEVVSPQL
ncbi:putative F-box protein [Panicum miliaceum]|uniref:F-box protein n=1 Tax=Panicum miliaceum TaxID=4540 RepID=A0A3L6Q1L0_PANMI|nr:putative F-box protein [Panicum miliaceum]